MIATPDPGFVFSSDDSLVIDLSESRTVDGVGLDEGVWEWEWRCQLALTGEDCSYEDGTPVSLPSGAKFESNEVSI